MPRNKRPEAILITIGCILIGAALACLIGLALTSGYASSKTVKPPTEKNDTVYVKLLDSMLARLAVQSNRSQNDTTPARGPDTKNRGAANESSDSTVAVDSAGGYRYKDDIAPLATNYTPRPDNSDSLTIAVRKKLQAAARQNSGYNLRITGLVLFAFLAFLFVRWTRDRGLLHLFATEQLSPRLQKLVEDHAQQIQKLDTPRKRKRFENKLRFQYSFLDTKGLLQNDKDLSCFLNFLLYFELHPTAAKDERSETIDRQVAVNIIKHKILSEHPDYSSKECTSGLEEEIIRLNMG